MKKLMVMLGIAAVATVASASTAKWSSDEVAGSADGYVVYCLLASDTSATWTKCLAASDAATMAGNVETAGNIASYAVKTAEIEDGAFASNKSTDYSSWGTDVTIKGYAVIFNADAIADATKYAITSVEDIKFASAGQAKTFDFDMTEATWNNIESVPEPTSGLLLLLGVAGLALRRRRA